MSERMSVAEFRAHRGGRARIKGAKVVVEDGIRFQSKLEAQRYRYWVNLWHVKAIRWFIRQAPFHLPGGVIYRADFPATEAAGLSGLYGGWKPSIFMPRRLSRITLEIVSIGVEGVREITPSDCFKEGIVCSQCEEPIRTKDFSKGHEDVVVLYRSLWETINGPGSWAKNPFVWVLTFKRV